MDNNTDDASGENPVAVSSFDAVRSSRYYPRESGSSSLTTSVTIRVTPEHFHLVSWGILWGGFLVAILIASWQVRIENKWFAKKRQEIEQGNAAPSGDGEAVSSADLSRSRFRRLLLVAMITRAITIPVQIWSDPLWLQFVADTLPDMTFATAWTLLVSFFVQLVGVALGTGASTNPGMIVLQATAYIVYVALVATFFTNQIAAVLLYALLCCIYAALFGTTMYFCPRLLTLLRPSLSEHSGLAIRLATCSILCVFIFGSRTLGFARKVVSPPQVVLWWWEYGVLELIPSVLFLIMMRPNVNRVSSGSLGNNNTPPTGGGRRGDTVPLLNRSAGYGSVSKIDSGIV